MKAKFFFFAFLLCSVLLSGRESSSDPGRENYLSIRRHYYKWDQGFEGSKGYFRKELYFYLIEMIGREIKTDYDFIPEYADSATHRSRLRSGRWLVITGIITADNYREIESYRKKYGRNSQPGKGLFSISGRIKKFRLSDYSGNREVYLYLDDMRLDNSKVKEE
ncbi:MAG TPA: hypothetical protein PK358_03890 [Spirochaetota bacterium]|nr:hypothetical protein [Spirochaetota bacterium]HPJ33949.1 hypothetical protein [Spirochaetota bacterium]